MSIRVSFRGGFRGPRHLLRTGRSDEAHQCNHRDGGKRSHSKMLTSQQLHRFGRGGRGAIIQLAQQLKIVECGLHLLSFCYANTNRRR